LTENLNRDVPIWTIGIAATFVLMLTVADIAATKFVEIGPVVTPAGAILFGIIFVVRDALHKVAGARVVRKVIQIAVGLNLFVGLYLYAMTRIPAPGFRPSDSFDAVFALAPGIVIGSVVAAFVSQYVNTALYQRLWDRNVGELGRVVGSNAVSLPVDAILFTFVGFVLVPMVVPGAVGIDVATAFARVASGQTLFKAAIMLAATPLVFLAPYNARARELR
jgi:uncharacterized integral membrane protein (TIGR00697 family)